MMKKILVLCEFSQVVTKAFRNQGHEAYSCDILPTEGNPDWHIRGDCLSLLDEQADIVIAHTPCTYSCNSGVRWLFNNGLKVHGRWEKMREMVELFNQIYYNTKWDKICMENPIPHKYAGLPKYSQIIQPWQFGHGETKATCLWLKNLPLLKPTDIVSGREQRIHKMSPSNNRGHERSRFYTGFADAMAKQWGNL
jgi:hypothetical protein